MKTRIGKLHVLGLWTLEYRFTIRRWHLYPKRQGKPPAAVQESLELPVENTAEKKTTTAYSI